jgi:hypothetical protein
MECNAPLLEAQRHEDQGAGAVGTRWPQRHQQRRGVEALRMMLSQMEVAEIEQVHHTIVGDDNRIFAEDLLNFLNRAARNEIGYG